MNVDSSVNISNGHVNAVVSAGNTSVNADIDVNNRNVQSDVQRRSNSVEAQAQTRSGNVQAEVNPHMSIVNDHAQLQNLDYEHAGHTGFQPTLTEENAGDGIDITDGVISCTVNGAEWGNITGDIGDQTDLTNALNSKQDVLTAGIGITIDEDNVISNDVSPLVPAQASVNNQLADKDFVNSSISTATATYRGNFNVVTDLNLHYDSSHIDIGNALDNEISIADNNDYSFVKIPTSDTTPTEIFAVERYKYNGTNWLYEYTLNNSGYTAEQWASINSGITDTKVTQYDGYATSKQNTLTPGTGINMVDATISTNNIVWRTW